MWRVGLLVVVLLAAVPVPASAAALWRGYNDNSTISRDLTPADDARLLARGGANSARITVDWKWVEQSQGALDLRMYDPIYHAWLARGIRPLLIVMGSPQWAWPPWWMWPDLGTCPDPANCHVPPDPAKDRQWAAFVRAVAARFPAAVGIEVWNEPNLGGFFATGADPVRYTQLLRLAHGAVKSVNPAMPVLGGSLAPVLTESTDPNNYGLGPFLNKMYATGAGDVMDGIAIHPYPQGPSHAVTDGTIAATRAVRDAWGDIAPLWLTELGATTTGEVNELQQANVLSSLIRRLRRMPDVAAIYVHTLLDVTRAAPSDPERGYGVLRSATLQKPAYCAVARAFGRGALRIAACRR